MLEALAMALQPVSGAVSLAVSDSADHPAMAPQPATVAIAYRRPSVRQMQPAIEGVAGRLAVAARDPRREQVRSGDRGPILMILRFAGQRCMQVLSEYQAAM